MKAGLLNQHHGSAKRPLQPPFVSTLDKRLFRAMSDARTEVQRRAEERRRAEAATAEERNSQEMERNLNSF